MSDKKQDYISWDEYFMGVALLASQRSKDPSTQVGACIVDKDKRILSTGYNGFPQGCSDDEFPWNRDESLGETKYQYVVHAELNAILNASGKSLAGSTVYVGLFPCHECAKAIIQAGTRRLPTLQFAWGSRPSAPASMMLNTRKVSRMPSMPINFSMGAAET